MGITLNYTTIDAAESADDWEVVDDAVNLDDSDYPPRQGDECIQWELEPNKTGGVRNKNAIDPFDLRKYQAGLWFLNPYTDSNGKKVVASVEDGIVLRLYSGDNWAEYFQPQYRLDNGDWKGGWMHLYASGDIGDEDRNSGTWGEDQISSIDRICVMVTAGDGDTTDKDSASFGTDWGIYYDKIIVTSDNDGDPWTLEDIYQTDIDFDSGDGIWGIVFKKGNYYSFTCGIQFGDGNSGSFQTKNEYIELAQKNTTFKYSLIIKDQFTLDIGTKDTVNDDIYVKDGVLFTGTNGPDFIIEDGATVNVYNSKLQGFDNIIIGYGNDSGSIEIINTDIYNNTTISINNPNISLTDSRLYSDPNNKQDLGTVDSSPTKLETLYIFNNATGLQFNVDYTVLNYIATNNDYDIVIKDDKNVNLINSKFDSNKIKRVD